MPVRLQNLEMLEVGSCCSLTWLVLEEREKGGIDDGIIKFCKLEILKLEDLSNLKSFCQSNSEASHLFNHQVFFPVLETLMIRMLLVREIWSKQTIQFQKESNKDSFVQLNEITILACDNLVSVFPSNMPARLQNLEVLKVGRCCSLTWLVSEEREKGGIDDGIIRFCKLEILKLEDLSNLKSFCQSNSEASHLFNHQVFFSVLETLMIRMLLVREIWSKQTIQFQKESNKDSFVQLNEITILACDNLVSVFPSNMPARLQNLEVLKVGRCCSLTWLVSEEREKGGIDDGIIRFCKLEILKLEDLSNLKSFCQSNSEASHLFNHQVFNFENLESSREILFWNLLPASKEYLDTVSIIGFNVSTKVLSHHQMRNSILINMLRLEKCRGFKHVIELNGTISIGEERSLDVKWLELFDLPELGPLPLWSKDCYEIRGFQSLKCITIIKCPQLRSMFTHSMAVALQHLEILSVGSCEMMEEIIIIEESDINFTGEEMATRHIEFPKLKALLLFNLPKLETFCKDERSSFSFSSLRRAIGLDCPKMKTFASGQICMPRGVGYETIDVTDHASFGLRNVKEYDPTYKVVKEGDDFEISFDTSHKLEIFFKRGDEMWIQIFGS